jgi:H+/Cl- antiporter ClcA
MDRYLSFENLVAKSFGLICAFGADFSIGKEGPFCLIGGA